MADSPFPADGVVHHALRVRYAETDQMRVAYYGRYFEWFEAARSEFCRARGIDYSELERQGLFLPVAEARCRYRAPARYDDELVVEIRVADAARRTIRFLYTVRRGDDVVAEGETVQVLVDSGGRPRSFPAALLSRFRGAAPVDGT